MSYQWLTKSLQLFVLACTISSVSLLARAGVECVPRESEEATIALVKKFYSAFNSRSGADLEGVLAVDWVDIPLPPGQGPGLKGMQESIENFGNVFADFTVVNDEILVAGNKVVVRSTNTGVHVGTFLGHPATNKSFAMTSIDIHTVCNGEIVETRHVEDWLGTLLTLGALPLVQ